MGFGLRFGNYSIENGTNDFMCEWASLQSTYMYTVYLNSDCALTGT